jgi:hypothetical protein
LNPIDSVPYVKRRSYDRPSRARRSEAARLRGLSQVTCGMVIAAQVYQRRLFHLAAIKG